MTQEGRARAVAAAYLAAVEENDIGAAVRLGDPNATTLIERGRCTRAQQAAVIRRVLASPVRTVETPQGVAFLGWMGERDELSLVQVVVGDGQRISSGYTTLREGTRVAPDQEWRVALMCSGSWTLVDVRDEPVKQRAERTLQELDDAVLGAWYFEGSREAEDHVRRALKEAVAEARAAVRAEQRRAHQAAPPPDQAAPPRSTGVATARPAPAAVAMEAVAVDTSLDDEGTRFAGHLSRAQQGDAASMGRVGWWYLTGFGTPQNCSAGMEWLRKAAAAGDPFATRELREETYRRMCP